MWFYPNGMASILSQHRMVVYSGRDIEYSTKAYHKSGNIRALRHDCVTSEGMKVTFTPNEECLHTLGRRNYFGLGKYGCVFGEILYLTTPTMDYLCATTFRHNFKQ